MPQMGVSVAEGTVVEWKKRVGDWVENDEPIVEISTDKVETEVPSPASGRVASLAVDVGETVDVGTVLATIETNDRPGQPHVDEHNGNGDGHAPPISPVVRACGPRSARSAITAASTFAASSARPRWSSSNATERIAAVGSAFCCPAMSGADPWTGSNIEGKVPSGLMLPEAASPMPPLIAPAKSVRMSPKRLSVTITSNLPGSVTKKIVAASTCR